MARKRLSTLAITTTLAAVGVGVVGAGAANAATAPQAHGNTNAVTAAPAAAVAVTAGTGSSSLTATASLAGTSVDPTLVAATTGTISWDSTKSATTPLVFDTTTGAVKTASLTNVYTAPGTYTVTVKVNDGTNAEITKTTTVTVTDETLAASLSASTVTKSKAVTLDLTGSSVDKSVANSAVTTISWGDKSTPATIKGDPALIKTGDANLTHTFAADGSYTVTVTLDDGLKTKTSVQTKTFTVKVSDTVVVQAAGATRYDTGVQISQHQWASTGVTTDTRTQAKAVVLATGNDFADALVAVPLAKKVQGPLLLTDGLATTTNSAVLTEIQRVLPTKGTKIFLLGGTMALNEGIEKQLQKLGYTTERLAGADRFATALDVATSKDAMNDPSHVIVARGDEGTNHDGFADALAAGPYAANVFGAGSGGSAVVLSNFKTFDPATQAYVQSKLHAGEQNVAAIGGQAATAMTAIKGSAGTYSTAVGATRYETAAMVASHFLPNGKGAQIGIATGTVFADALTGGAYQATVGGPLLLTDPKVLPASTAAAVAGFSTQEINIFGGNAAISPAVAKEIAALLNVTTIGKF
ncbi:cell wall-binding repeat-containing protein [Catenulispora rubra]|uniref:cell wall-binding repeat-containing protein n=1 Tax=Catenulispora rubra TaxID=280293 RepID=UPI001892034A|nr:cell wall-binding repeat-containing protein [Catenulispora rubra]